MFTSITQVFEDPRSSEDALPARLGRYRIIRELGSGAFGRVFLAEDELLKRPVALKLLHLRSSSTALVGSFLSEARMIAQMDHPGIVPIFDATETDAGEFCIVSRFVEGFTLRQRLQEGPVPYAEAASLVARLGEALHHAHRLGVVHRDVKPANIMLTTDGRPVLLDFGLAKSIQDLVQDGMVAGTPGYLSPEQARGEDHLLSGRSDIFSLGAVFYELLTARRAFHATSIREQLDLLEAGGPPPPREIAPAVPRELARICMKAMHPQLRFRYPVILDMAGELHAWLNAASDTVAETIPAFPRPTATVATARSEKLRVVPRGLRAFDAGDSDFFLMLVPGPRDQFGLPESLRFWKQRVESTDAHLAFRVGVLYGPSGCGKSSLLGAGLLPRCADHVRVVYHEARNAGNAARLARTLHLQFPALDSAETSPANLIHKLRTNADLRSGQKLLLVIDQTEQWLRACETPESDEGTALRNTLRQCDGVNVQALLLVRDDFWRGVSRLLAEADVEIVSGNSALVDLFEPRHAEIVLESFGRAYRCLPEDPGIPLSSEAREFIRHSVQNLAEGGKVSPVRLTLFTEMFRSRPWTVASLRSVGGASGVAVAFLEEVFKGTASSGPRRIHEPAARRILQELVPPTGDVRGPACRQATLLAVSGYGEKLPAFQEVLQMLDSDLRLLTPVDPDDTGDGEPAWQLTHDYMVPALRQWLLKHQANTRRGRAEIALAERAREWEQRPVPARLPGIWEWLRLRLLTRQRRWSPAESAWMRGGMQRVRRVTLCCALLAWAALLILREAGSSLHGRAVAEQILMAAPGDVSALLKEGARWEKWTTPILEKAATEPISAPTGLNARLALVGGNPAHVEALATAMLEADAPTFDAIRLALAQHSARPSGHFQQVLDDSGATNGRKLRALAALAAWSNADPAEARPGEDVARWLLTSVNEVGAWAAYLRPLAGRISPALEEVLRAPPSQAAARQAASALASLHTDQAGELIRLLRLFPPSSVPLLVTALRAHPDAPELLAGALDQAAPGGAPTGILAGSDEAAYTARCNLLLAGLSLGLKARCWPQLERGADRTLRTFLILNAAAADVPPELFATRLLEEPDAGRRHALLLALSGYPISALPASLQGPVIEWLRRALPSDPDGGVHSAIITLLQRWSLDGDLAAWQKALPKTEAPLPGMGWWVTPSGVDMRIIVLKDGTRAAVGAQEVQIAEYARLGKPPSLPGIRPTAASAPVTGLAWIDAARYCNAITKAEGMDAGMQCYLETDGNWTSPADALQRRGYRLPTRAEWSAAASSAPRHRWDFGDAISHVPLHGWIAINAGDIPRAVARLLPNEQGLWDTMGNASEFTHDWLNFVPSPLIEVAGWDYATVAAQLKAGGWPKAGISYQRPQAGIRLARSIPRSAPH